MFTNLAKFEFKVADKVYHFLCDVDSPIEHVKEVVFQLSQAVGQLEKMAKERADQQQQQIDQDPLKPEVENVEPTV